MNYCQDCVFWRPSEVEYLDEEFDPQTKKSGRCDCPKLVYWQSLKQREPPIGDGDTLFFQDAENYDCSLWTGPNFGCVHWKALQ